MNTSSRLLRFSVVVISLIFLAGCSSLPSMIIPSSTSSPTVEATLPATPVVVAPNPSVTPTTETTPVGTPIDDNLNPSEPPTGGGLAITLDNNGQTITLSLGQSFLLKLGDGYQWNVASSDANILSRVVNIAVVRGAQGIYKAHEPGTAELNATGDPICRSSTPPCMAPSILFHIKVVVK